MVNLHLLSLIAFAASSAGVFKTVTLPFNSVLSLTEYVMLDRIRHKPFTQQ
jgi:hypothetical protein